MSVATLLLALAVAATPPATPTPPRAPTPAEEPAAAVEAKKIQVEFRGSLRDALKQIAARGGLNLVVTGDLDKPAEVYLRGVTAEEALQTIAQSYDLHVHRRGSIWTLRPMTAAERETKAEKQEDAAEAPDAAQEAIEASAAADEKEFASSTVSTGAVHIGPGQVAREAVALGGSVLVEGRVEGDAVAVGGSLELGPNAVVEGNAVAFGGSVTMGPRARVDGDVTAFGGDVTRGEGSVVKGEVTSLGGRELGLAMAKLRPGQRHKADAVEEDHHADEAHVQIPIFSSAWRFLSRFLLLFTLGFLFLIFMPARMKEVEAELRRDPVRCGLTGLVGAFALLPLSVLLAVTIVGIPLMFALWMLVAVGVAMGISAVASQLGTQIPVLQGRKTQAVVLALGLLLMLLAAMVPVLGPLAFMAVMLVALGVVIRTRFGTRQKGVPQPV